MKISTTTGYLSELFGEEQAIRFLANVGFDAMDYSAFFHYHYGQTRRQEQTGFLFQPFEKLEAYYQHLKDVADEAGIVFGQMHAPYPSVFTDADTIPQASFEIAEKSIRIAGILKAPYLIIHPCFVGNAAKELSDKELKSLNVKYYSALAPLAKEQNVVICLENMWGTDNGKICPTVCSRASQFCDFIDTLNELVGEERFAACLDVGHALLTQQDAASMIHSLGHRLKTLHLHDNDGVDDIHNIPMIGKLNWESICKALKEVDYQGTFSLEADTYPRYFGKDLIKESCSMMLTVCRHLIKKYELE